MIASLDRQGRINMSKVLYALGDADNIRRRMEGMLLSNNLRGLAETSTSLSNAIQDLGDRAEKVMKAEIVFRGGDDILLLVQPENFEQESLRELMEDFEEKTGSTISFGVGSSAEEAFLNLARAKSTGPGTLIVAVS